MANQSQDSEIPTPAFLWPAIRCGIEMALVGSVVLLAGLPASNTLYLGFVFISAIVAMTVVLFWCLNQQMRAWIAYAQGKPTGTGGSWSLLG
jgi:hypothetical protein